MPGGFKYKIEVKVITNIKDLSFKVIVSIEGVGRSNFTDAYPSNFSS